MLRIEQLDAVHSKCMNKNTMKVIKELLSFESVFYQKVGIGKGKKFRIINKRREYMKSMMDRKGIFLSGFLPRIEAWCFKMKKAIEIIKVDDNVQPCPPQVPKITFRDYQSKIILDAAAAKRGVIVSPTGSGKTIMALGILSCWPDAKVLVLNDKKDLLTQLRNEFRKYRFDKRTDFYTIQAFKNKNPEEYCDKYDIVVIDEAHHVSDVGGMYAKVLQNMITIYRYGFTATYPTDAKTAFALEGLIGPKVAEMTYTEAKEKKILPIVKITLVPLKRKSYESKKYADIYREAIVRNIERNRKIVRLCSKENNRGNSCLVMVKEIEHGEILENIAKKLKLNCRFIQGSTDGSIRGQVKTQFKQKKINTVIATVIWKEGIDIPSLDCIINAIGGKSEIQTLQSIGRGFRRTDDKMTVRIYDFLDMGRYVAEHAILRIKTYCEKGWL